MSDIEKLIEKEKEKLIARLKKEVEGLEMRIIDEGLKQFNSFADTLKIAYSAQIIGQEGLLRTIEKGGFIYHRTIDTRERHMGKISISHFIEDLAASELYSKDVPMLMIEGKQKVTIIIEPLEE